MEITIKPRVNGPFKISVDTDEEVKDLISFDNQEITFSKNTAICRCGRSNIQPLCDGTHKKVGFNSDNLLEEEIIQKYVGTDITIVFNRSICSGTAECVHKFPNIYISASENWIFPDKGSVEEVKESIKNCPSGALTYMTDMEITEENNSNKSITISSKGPLFVKGKIEMIEVNQWSTNANKQKFALCRCGASVNKPFCDYSHASLKDKDSSGIDYTF